MVAHTTSKTRFKPPRRLNVKKFIGKRIEFSGVSLFAICLLLLLLNLSSFNSGREYGEEKTTVGAQVDGRVNNNNNNKLKFSMRNLLVPQKLVKVQGGSKSSSSTRISNLLRTNQYGEAAAIVVGSSDGNSEYKCAKFCSCSVIQVQANAGKAAAAAAAAATGAVGVDSSSSWPFSRANLTRAKCESSQFTDVLTIDRRTQIIHISLPPQNQLSATTTTTTTVKSQQDYQTTTTPKTTSSSSSFRMPRLVQFNILREIVIINLKFQVCDTEVFKRGQKLRRFQLNYNQLSRISKACLKHLEKLVELNLDYNQLDELESALFSSLINLRILSIAYNQLSELAAHQFVNLTKLVSLNLVGNSFKTINLHLFEPMQNSLRLLMLAKNQIKSFVYAPIQQQQQLNKEVTTNSIGATTTTTTTNSSVYNNNNIIQVVTNTQTKNSQNSFAGVVFKNLLKLNVDQNKLERIKLMQLHRFFNVKFLSIRENNIAMIRDKAFNGLKLIELNLAQNQLQTISKCAFCNATIRRLVLARNNITFQPIDFSSSIPRPLASPLITATTSNESGLINQMVLPSLPEPAAQQQQQDNNNNFVPPSQQKQQQQQQQQLDQSSTIQSSSQNLLILSKSIFGPLFGQLTYLDLSNNEFLAEHLESLLEPLLKLEYLNLASVGLDRSLPSPNLFKNLRQLKYLNLSHNQLDQLISETVEPLLALEVLDLSYNKFSELDETFLITLDDLTSLRVLNFGSNPWFCSQCKIAPLYDWILRSQIYNSTCIAAAAATNPLILDRQQGDTFTGGGGTDGLPITNSNDDGDNGDNLDAKSGLAYKPHVMTMMIGGGGGGGGGSNGDSANVVVTPDYSLLIGGDDDKIEASTLIDHFDLITTITAGNPSITQPLDELAADLTSSSSSSNQLMLLATNEDDLSIAQTMENILIRDANNFVSLDYCMKCEFPSELRSYNLHELSSGDFKICPGAAPRYAASEPKIGLTLALVIIGVLFCIIIIVIVMYRRKSNTYYPNEDTDHLDGGVGINGKKPVFSISSDGDHQYDATDYSSPPMSQSYESYSQDDDDDDVDDEEEEDEEDEDEDLDEEEEEEDEEDEDDDKYIDEEDETDEEKNGGGGDDDDDDSNNNNNNNIKELERVNESESKKDDEPKKTSDVDNDVEKRKSQPPGGASSASESHPHTSSSRQSSTKRRSTKEGGGGAEKQQKQRQQVKEEKDGRTSKQRKQNSQSIRSILSPNSVSSQPAATTRGTQSVSKKAANKNRRQTSSSTNKSNGSQHGTSRTPSSDRQTTSSNLSATSQTTEQGKVFTLDGATSSGQSSKTTCSSSQTNQQQQSTGSKKKEPSQEGESSWSPSSSHYPPQGGKQEQQQQLSATRLLHFETPTVVASSSSSGGGGGGGGGGTKSGAKLQRKLKQSSLEYQSDRKRAVKSAQTIDNAAAASKERLRSSQSSGYGMAPNPLSRVTHTHVHVKQQPLAAVGHEPHVSKQQTEPMKQEDFKAAAAAAETVTCPVLGDNKYAGIAADQLHFRQAGANSRQQRFASGSESTRDRLFSTNTTTTIKNNRQHQHQLVRESTRDFDLLSPGALEATIGQQVAEEVEMEADLHRHHQGAPALDRVLSPTFSDATTADGSLAGLEEPLEKEKEEEEEEDEEAHASSAGGGHRVPSGQQQQQQQQRHMMLAAAVGGSQPMARLRGGLGRLATSNVSGGGNLEAAASSNDDEGDEEEEVEVEEEEQNRSISLGSEDANSLDLQEFAAIQQQMLAATTKNSSKLSQKNSNGQHEHQHEHQHQPKERRQKLLTPSRNRTIRHSGGSSSNYSATLAQTGGSTGSRDFEPAA